MNQSPIKHLYFFDDLSYHIKRIAKLKKYSELDMKDILTEVWDKLLSAFKCLNHFNQDFVLINWDHACAQLAYHLNWANKTFDVMIAQGCNGDYALKYLNEYNFERFGYNLSPVNLNVRIAHILNNPEDAFYSTFSLGVSKGKSLEEQCQDVANEINKIFLKNKTLVKIAIFDDCIQTAEGTKATGNLILKYLDTAVKFEINGVGFIGCEQKMFELREMKWNIWIGVLLRGKTYPTSWEWDIYFLKDLFLDNAIRFTDGTSLPYCAGGWFDKIFSSDKDSATKLFFEIQLILKKAEIYDDLLQM